MLDEGGFWLTSLGLSLRELIHEYKHQSLVLFKCCLLQPKVTRTMKKDVWMFTEIGRCFSSVHAVRGCACCNSL